MELSKNNIQHPLSLYIDSPIVMGILNATPDSFYSASRCMSDCAIIERIELMIDNGVDWLDMGGCSTRPGSEMATDSEEWQRINNSMQIIRKHFSQLTVSVDTFRAGIVQRLFDKYGAFIVNDISAGDDDPEMIPTVARLQLPFIAMHKRGTSQTMQQLTDYTDVTDEVKNYLQNKLNELHIAGVNNVIIDPGFGFAKTVEQNYEMLCRLNEFTKLGAPLLVGISRKGMLWKLLDCTPHDVLCATSAVNLQALLSGADIIRVHDVKEAKQMVKIVKMMNSIKVEYKNRIKPF